MSLSVRGTGNKMCRRLSLYLCILFVAGILTGWFHHHGGQFVDSDCPICIAIQQSAVTSYQTEPTLFAEQAVKFVAVPELPLPSSWGSKSLFVRGPPN